MRALAGDINAMSTLGYNYQHGLKNLSLDLEEAIKWYEMAAEHNDPNAMNNLGLMYKNGEGVKQEYKKAISLLKQSSNLNNKYALSNLAYMHLFGQGTEKNPNKAIELYIKSGEAGFPKGYYRAANQYYIGENVPKDLNKAIELYKKAADKGHTQAQYWLHKSIIRINTGASELLLAGEYLAKSSKAGHDYAIKDLDSYIKKCSKGKIKHYMRSCYLAAYSGNTVAMYAVAPSYKKGRSNHKNNPKKTLEWVERNAYEGLAKDQLSLAQYYKHGTGTNVDLIKAYAWQTIGLHQLKYSKIGSVKYNAISANIIGFENRRLLFSLTPEEFNKAQEYISEIKTKIAELSENK